MWDRELMEWDLNEYSCPQEFDENAYWFGPLLFQIARGIVRFGVQSLGAGCRTTSHWSEAGGTTSPAMDPQKDTKDSR